MQYGYFDNAHREYIITRPDTPLPWINYLGCETYFGLISNTAGGYAFYRDARLRRLTRYRYNNAPLDSGGRYIYLRDDGRDVPAERLYWSPSWQPARRALDDYTCRHGMGYTVIGSTYRGIEASTRYFVPLGENLEVWQLTVTNHRARVGPDLGFLCYRVLPVGRAGRRDQLPAQLQHRPGRGRGRGRGDLPQDRVPRAPRSLRLLRLFRAAGRLRYPARRVPGTVPRLGRSRGRGARPGV